MTEICSHSSCRTGHDPVLYLIFQIHVLTVRDITVITLLRHVSTWRCTKYMHLQYVILQLSLYCDMFRHDGTPNASNTCTYSTWYYSYHFTATCFDMTVHQIHVLTVGDITVITLLRHVSTWRCTKCTKYIYLQYVILQLSRYCDMFRHDGAPNTCTYSTWYYSYHVTATCFDMTMHQMHQIHILTVRDN